MPLDLLKAARSQATALVGEIVVQHGAHCLSGASTVLRFLGTWIPAQANLGVELAGYLARTSHRHCRHGCNSYFALLIANLELIHKGAGATGTDPQTKTW